MKKKYFIIISIVSVVVIAGFYVLSVLVPRCFVQAIVVDNSTGTANTNTQSNAQQPVNPPIFDIVQYITIGWWGQVNTEGISVMNEPSTQSKTLGKFYTINRIKVLEEVLGETINGQNLWYKIDGGQFPGGYIFSTYVDKITQPEPPTDFTIPDIVTNGDYWIDVNLTKKILTLFKYDKPAFSTYVSTGRPYSPTITGTFRIWWKLKKDRMVGRTVYHSYNLPNVPFVMYYHGGYGIHGTYWHDKFGTQQSAGCTNLTQGDAEYLFGITKPDLLSGKTSVLSTADNLGTVVYNHY